MYSKCIATCVQSEETRQYVWVYKLTGHVATCPYMLQSGAPDYRITFSFQNSWSHYPALWRRRCVCDVFMQPGLSRLSPLRFIFIAVRSFWCCLLLLFSTSCVFFFFFSLGIVSVSYFCKSFCWSRFYFTFLCFVYNFFLLKLCVCFLSCLLNHSCDEAIFFFFLLWVISFFFFFKYNLLLFCTCSVIYLFDFWPFFYY